MNFSLFIGKVCLFQYFHYFLSECENPLYSSTHAEHPRGRLVILQYAASLSLFKCFSEIFSGVKVW